MGKSFAAAILRTALRHRKAWIIEQVVLMILALLSAAMSETSTVVVRIFLIYLVAALLFGCRRWWRELEATYRRQQQHIEKLSENAESHASDLAEVERVRRQAYTVRLFSAKADFEMNLQSNRRGTERIQAELQSRNLEVGRLEEENAQLRRDIDALHEQAARAAPPSEEPPGA